MPDSTANKNYILESSAGGAAAFHRLTGVAESQRSFERRFHEKYVDEEKGLVFPEMLRKRNCPLCGVSTGRVLFVKNGFRHISCPCGMTYVPEILKNDLNLPYSGGCEEKKTHDSFRNDHRLEFIRSIYRSGLGFLARQGVLKGELLDAGCSSGFFLEYAEANGFRAVGVEPSVYAAKEAEKRGLNVVCGMLSSKLFPESSFDVVTIWDVLEHVSDPVDFLGDVFKLLKPGGTVFLQVPNVSSMAASILHEKCNMFNGYGHINLFSPESAERAISFAGFSAPVMQTVISEFSVIENHLNYEDPYLGKSPGCTRLWKELSESWLHRELLGYKLQVSARKRQL